MKMIQITTLGLGGKTGVIQTIRNLVGNGTGVPIRNRMAGILKSDRMKSRVMRAATSAVQSVVYAGYTPEVYRRTRALIDAVAWIPTTDVQPPKTPAMMLTIKHRATAYKRLNFAYPKTNKHGTQAKYGEGTYAKFFLPKFQPSFIKPADSRLRDFFSVWKSTVPTIVRIEFRVPFHRFLVAAKAGL